MATGFGKPDRMLLVHRPPTRPCCGSAGVWSPHPSAPGRSRRTHEQGCCHPGRVYCFPLIYATSIGSVTANLKPVAALPVALIHLTACTRCLRRRNTPTGGAHPHRGHHRLAVPVPTSTRSHRLVMAFLHSSPGRRGLISAQAHASPSADSGPKATPARSRTTRHPLKDQRVRFLDKITLRASLIHLADAPQHGSAAWIGGQATDP
jgi:hypothetical protein